MTLSRRGVVVVGAGVGGLRTVEGLRLAGYSDQLTLLGGEQREPYDRPPLTKEVLREASEVPWLRTEYGSLDVRIVLGSAAVAIDPQRRVVVLARGDEIGYDSLVLAPGARPRLLPGVESRPGLHVLHTLDDALALREVLGTVSSIIIVGAGFIGCEIAASARARGVAVRMVEALPGPLARIVGPIASAEIVAMHEANGVEIITGVGVAEVLGTDHVEELVLSDGRRLETTEVVLALGVIPAVDWLADSGLEIDNGIVCSAAGRASLPHVYAVGDAARWWHPLANEHRRIEHWTSAGEQARVVAANIVAGPDGPETELAKVPYFWSDQHGVMIQAFGFIGDGAESQVIKVKDRTVVLYSRRGRLVGALGFSAPRPLMRLRALIANRAPVADAVTLLQPEFANAEGGDRWPLTSS